MSTNTFKNYVDGKWQEVNATEFLEVINPATNDVLGKVPLSSAADVDQAVKAAVEARLVAEVLRWSHKTKNKKRRYLLA